MARTCTLPGENLYILLAKFCTLYYTAYKWLLSPLTELQTNDLFEIIEARYGESSTIFIAQSAPAGWYQMIGESRIADAILDRIVHNSYEILIEGDLSMRERMGLTEI